MRKQYCKVQDQLASVHRVEVTVDRHSQVLSLSEAFVGSFVDLSSPTSVSCLHRDLQVASAEREVFRMAPFVQDKLPAEEAEVAVVVAAAVVVVVVALKADSS